MPRRQNKISLRGVSNVAHKTLVANIDEVVGNKFQVLKRGGDRLRVALGSRTQASNDRTPELDYRQFVYELLLRRKVPKQQASHISQNAWRQSTFNKKSQMLRKWYKFMKEKALKSYDLSFNNIMAFLHIYEKTGQQQI